MRWRTATTQQSTDDQQRGEKEIHNTTGLLGGTRVDVLHLGTELGVLERMWGADDRCTGSQTVAAVNSSDDKLLDCGCDGKNRCRIRAKLDNHLIADPGCPFTMENVDWCWQHILDTFSSSIFNPCENQQLLMMKGPPVRITLKDGATPVF